MHSRQAAPCGTWRSPITAALATSGSVQFQGLQVDGDALYWIEQRPSEGGRNVVVAFRDGTATDVTPAPFNVRTRVHEYGGGAFTVSAGTVYFSNFADGGLYRQTEGGDPEPVNRDPGMRYADFVHDARRNRLVAVREDHTREGGEAVNEIVAVDLSGGGVTVLLSGADFYAAPRLDPDAAQLAWFCWNHPEMPWNGTELYRAQFDEKGRPRDIRLVAGAREESVSQPAWSPDGELYFVSDRSGWWNLYKAGAYGVEALAPQDAEFGLPQWTFGVSTYGFRDADTIICGFARNGEWSLAELEIPTKQLKVIPLPYRELRYFGVTSTFAVFVAGSPREPFSVVRLSLDDGTLTLLRNPPVTGVDPSFLSAPLSIEFPTEGGHTSYGHYYPPTNPDFSPMPGERPPLLVKCHGGPTAASSLTLNLGIQFWTSRGFAVLDVDYRGSTGYGRSYRALLEGNWGVADVEDCINGARYLIAAGDADADRLAIDGGSAGGYTVLCALTFHDTFRAGASYYGVSDLELLQVETHKFESRYDRHLVGPYPERRDLFVERSPIHFVERLSSPVIFFQGSEDKVVPPNQAQLMVEAMRERGVPVAYIEFEGEGHGFRRGENVIRSLEAELYFYGRIFGFEPADPIEPVPIDNLKQSASV